MYWGLSYLTPPFIPVKTRAGTPLSCLALQARGLIPVNSKPKGPHSVPKSSVFLSYKVLNFTASPHPPRCERPATQYTLFPYMPELNGWTAHIRVDNCELPETNTSLSSSGRTKTCRISCSPGKHFDIKLINPQNDRPYIVLYLIDDIIHDEYLLQRGYIRDISTGWSSQGGIHPYEWIEYDPKERPSRIDVKSAVGSKAKESKNLVGTVTIRLFASQENEFLEPGSFRPRPTKLRFPPQTRRLVCYAGLGPEGQSPHPSRLQLGIIRALLKERKPEFQFQFQYWHEVVKPAGRIWRFPLLLKKINSDEDDSDDYVDDNTTSTTSIQEREDSPRVSSRRCASSTPSTRPSTVTRHFSFRRSARLASVQSPSAEVTSFSSTVRGKLDILRNEQSNLLLLQTSESLDPVLCARKSYVDSQIESLEEQDEFYKSHAKRGGRSEQ